jgi:hypothetical protein
VHEHRFPHTRVVWSAVVDAFPQHEGCILVGTFMSTAVVQYWCVLILVAVVIDHVIFAKTRFNLYPQSVQKCTDLRRSECSNPARPLLVFQFQSLCMVVATEAFVLGSLLIVGALFLFFPLFHVVTLFFFSAFETNFGEVTCWFRKPEVVLRLTVA